MSINYNVMNYHEQVINRFWDKVNVVYKDDGTPDFDVCWEWNASCDKDGYGQFSINSRPCRSHRFIYECFNGPIPEGLCALHECDNPPCVNPYHLWVDTNEENTKDKVKKGRQSKEENHGRAILTNNQVIQILTDIKNNKYNNVYEIIDKYAITIFIIRRILNNRLWIDISSKFCQENGIKLLDLKKKIVKENFKGSNNPNCKLNENKINCILTDIKNNKYNDINQIADDYNITRETIRFVLNNRLWTDISSKFCQENGIKLLDLKKRVAKNISGSNNPSSKLIDKQISQIKYEFQKGIKTNVQLAKEYGVSPVTIGNIKNKKTYI